MCNIQFLPASICAHVGGNMQGPPPAPHPLPTRSLPYNHVHTFALVNALNRAPQSLVHGPVSQVCTSAVKLLALQDSIAVQQVHTVFRPVYRFLTTVVVFRTRTFSNDTLFSPPFLYNSVCLSITWTLTCTKIFGRWARKQEKERNCEKIKRVISHWRAI